MRLDPNSRKNNTEIEEILAQARGKKFQQEMLDFLEQDQHLRRMDEIFSAELAYLKLLPQLSSLELQDAINAVSDEIVGLYEADRSETGTFLTPVVICTMLLGIDRFVRGVMEEEESTSYRKYIDQFKESERPKLRGFRECLIGAMIFTSVFLMVGGLIGLPLLLMIIPGIVMSTAAYVALTFGSLVSGCLMTGVVQNCFNRKGECRSYPLFAHTTSRLFNKAPKNEAEESVSLKKSGTVAVAC
ncbi:MAG: hypothetical protein A3F41_04095 [Coxiella sp. RIFCSPHIGHO2_12_FULL_44_14]|nr:MAG: hypothetical protein A3F41_04095 [Coxiella sp. RIFCSPHIGHO2_12_FULL_44_14]